MASDLKHIPTIRNPELYAELHWEWRECVLCLATWPLSLHHVCKHPRDDVRGNLVMVCGDGVSGCHGLLEAHAPTELFQLGRHILTERADIVAHLVWRLGEEEAREWLRRNLWVDL